MSECINFMVSKAGRSIDEHMKIADWVITYQPNFLPIEYCITMTRNTLSIEAVMANLQPLITTLNRGMG